MNRYIKYFLPLIIFFLSCSSENSQEDLIEEPELTIEYNPKNSIIENTLTIDSNVSNIANTSINLKPQFYNILELKSDIEYSQNSNGEIIGEFLGYKYLSYIAKDTEDNTIYKITVGEIFGSSYLEEGKEYDLSNMENYKDIILTIFDTDGNYSQIFSANYHKNTATNTHGLGTFKIVNLVESDDNNDMNDIIEIQFNDVYLYDLNKQLKFSGILKAYIIH